MSPFRTLFWTFSSLGAVALLGWGLFGWEGLHFRELRVVGNSRVSETAVRHLADLAPETPLLLLDLGRAVEGIERHPWVAEADARRVFPDTVVVNVREREVKALVLLDALYFVDAEGVVFRKASAPDLDHPVITGLAPDFVRTEPLLAGRILKEALGWIDAAAKHPGLDEDNISELRFDAKSGYTLALRNGGEVLLGFEEVQILERVDALVKQGVDLQRPHRIDLAAASLAVVTPL